MRWFTTLLTFMALLVPGLLRAAGPTNVGPAPVEATGSRIVDPGPLPGTPVVDPEPDRAPLVLPALWKRYDPRLPPPLAATARGYVATLNAAGKAACAPATHVLLSGQEGANGARPIAVMHAESADPLLELDLYVGDPVEVTGLVSLTPTGCSGVTWQLMAVTRVRRLDLPPGEPPFLTYALWAGKLVPRDPREP